MNLLQFQIKKIFPNPKAHPPQRFRGATTNRESGAQTTLNYKELKRRIII